MTNNQFFLSRGTTLQGGKYVITNFIASGGFGITYEARHAILDRRVAIKEFFVKDFCNRNGDSTTVSVGTRSREELVAKLKKKFINEAIAISKFDNPNIVRVHDVFEENGTAYYVMDFIDGQSLKDIVKANGALSEAKSLKYIRQIASALAEVHKQNRLHLDVKPSNIMINKDDDAILIDFGASKQYDIDGENTSTLIGLTPGYAPLELIDGAVKIFTPATDIYSLGATLFKITTGVTPLKPTELLIKGGIDLPDNMSPIIKEAIKSSMLVNPDSRPQRIEDFLTILNNTHATAQVNYSIESIVDANNEETLIYDDINPNHTNHNDDHLSTEVAGEKKEMVVAKTPSKALDREWLGILVMSALIAAIVLFITLWAISQV